MATPASKTAPVKPQTPAKPKAPLTPAEQRAKSKESAESILAALDRTARKTARLLKKNHLSEAQMKAFRDGYSASLEGLDRAIQPATTSGAARIPDE